MLTVEQQENRKNGLGATDCAAVMGLSPYRTPYELWLIKTGRMEEPSILTDDKLHLRHAHEETISREYMRRKGVKLKRVNKTIYHPTLPFMMCHLDRVVIGVRKIIECKTSTAFLKHRWGEEGSDNAPIEYLLQVQHQLACTGFEDADIASLIDIDDYRIFNTPRNEKVISKLENECERFWNENVLKDVPPAASNRNDLLLMYPTNNGNFLECDSSITLLLDNIEKIKYQSKSLDEDRNGLEKELIEIIKDNDGIKDGEKVIVTYKANAKGSKILLIKKRG